MLFAMRLSAVWCLVLGIVSLSRAGNLPVTRPSDYPSWWFTRDILPPLPESAYKYYLYWPADYPPADDYAAANIGQLKHFVHKAAEEMIARHGANAQLDAFLASLDAPVANADDYSVCNIGQLKAVASPLYDRINQIIGRPAVYPWSGSPVGDDYAVANLGQMKNLFSFSLDGGGISYGDPDSFTYEWDEPLLRQIAGPATSLQTIADEILLVTTGGTYIADHVLRWELAPGSSEAMTRISSDTGILEPDAADPAVWRANAPGTCQVTLSTPTLTISSRVTVSVVTPPATSVFSEFASGSLIKHIHDSVSGLLAGKTAGDATQRILNPDGTRNSNLWTGSTDLSSLVVGSSTGWIQGALVTPLHVIVAKHVPVQAVGATYTFRRKDNTGVVTRTVTAAVNCGGDIHLLTLNEPITYAADGVNFAKVLPANAASYWKPGSYGWRYQLPILKCIRNGGHRLGASLGRGTSVSLPRPAWMSAWYVEWHGGDSGSAVGTVIDGEYIFLGNAWTGSNEEDDGSSSVFLTRADIDTALVGSGYSLTDVNLGSFPTY